MYSLIENFLYSLIERRLYSPTDTPPVNLYYNWLNQTMRTNDSEPCYRMRLVDELTVHAGKGQGQDSDLVFDEIFKVEVDPVKVCE